MVDVQEIPPSEIEPSPYQPRTEFDEEEMVQLMDSIRQRGVMQPVVVRRRQGPDVYEGRGRWELVMGERRLRACRRLGLPAIPAVVKELTDEEAKRECLAENLIRSQLKPMEKARAYGGLIEQGWSQQQIATRLSLTMAEVEFHLRLLKLRPEYQEYVASGILPVPQANDLARLPHEHQPAVFRLIRSGKDVNEVSRVISAMLEAQAQDKLLDAEGTKAAADKLFTALRSMAAAIGRCTSRETMDLLAWVSEGDVARNLQLAELCQKELFKVIERLRKARGRSEAKNLLASSPESTL